MLNEPIRILIVSHYVEFRQSLRRLMDRGRWGRLNQPTFLEATTGAEGYERCRVDQPHCVLVDHRLPELDGVQFVERLPKRTLPDSGFPVVMMLTDSSDEAEAARLMRHSVHEVVIKDKITAETMDETIRRGLAMVRHRQRVETKTRKLSLAKAQLHAAGEIQKRMLPVTAPRLPVFDLAGVCQPADETGGDFFDYIQCGDDSLAVASDW